MNSIFALNHMTAPIPDTDFNATSNPVHSHIDFAQAAEESAARQAAPVSPPPFPGPRVDQYIPEKEPAAPGVYQVVPDEKGLRSIDFKPAEKAQEPPEALRAQRDQADKKEPLGAEKLNTQEGAKPSDKAAEEEGPEEICITNTDQVDREIQRLREKLRQLQQQLACCCDHPTEQRKLEKQIQQVEQELQVKDTDSYRRQQAECQAG